MNDVVHFDFVRKIRKSTVTQITECAVGRVVEDLDDVLTVLENTENSASLIIGPALQEKIDVLNYLCDKVGEELHRLGFDVAATKSEEENN